METKFTFNYKIYWYIYVISRGILKPEPRICDNLVYKVFNSYTRSRICRIPAPHIIANTIVFVTSYLRPRIRAYTIVFVTSYFRDYNFEFFFL